MSITTYPTIYKRTATGAIQQWSIEVEDDRYRSISGQVGGKLVTTEWTVAQPTNVGKANYRDGSAQAIFEVDAAYKKRLEKDYYESADDIDTPKVRLPMLAKEYNEHKHKLNFSKGVFIQPKLDGIRSTACPKILMSRNGKHHVGTPHILRELAPIFQQYKIITDGELYNHEYKDDFNTICSAVKKKNCTPEILAQAEQLIEYHIYDIFDPEQKMVYRQRLDILLEIAEKYDLNAAESKIKVVPTTVVKTAEEITKNYEMYMADGFEGAIVRSNDLYYTKRTDKLLKYKEFIDEEFVVVDIIEGQGNWTGRAKSAVLQFPDGRTFSSGIRGNQSFLGEVLINKDYYIGKLATVRYFNLTPDGIPRFPVIKELDRQDI